MERLVGERQKKTEINFSMQNLLDETILGAVFAASSPIELHVALAKRAGYQGVEFFPFIIPDIQIRTRLYDPSVFLDSVRSAHQSWRSEKTFGEVRKHPRPQAALFAYVTIEEKVASLKTLKRLQDILGESLPMVVFPVDEWRGERGNETFIQLKRKLVQPTPELLRLWKVRTPEEFWQKARSMGFSGICLDLYHIRRLPVEGEVGFGHWSEVVPSFLPFTREIHLGVGRRDFRGVDSQKELEDLYTGEGKTDISKILELIKNNRWKGPVVTEIPVVGIRDLLGINRFVTPQEIVRVHQRIVENLKGMINF